MTTPPAPDPRFRRIVYASRSTGAMPAADLAAILAVSRLNNGLDGVSGILWSGGDRYVQVLEGPPDSVAATFARITADPRHAGVDVLSDVLAEERAFGDWAMAGMPGERPADAAARLARLLRGAPAEIRTLFEGEA